MFLLAALGWLLTWRWAASRIGCSASAIFLLGIWVALLSSSYEWALLRRIGFVAHYLKSGGFLARWLVRRALLLTWIAVKNLPVALILFTATLSLSGAEWLVLAADLLLLLLVLGAMERLFDHEAVDLYVRPLARIWAHRINAAALWAALVAVNFYTPHPNYIGISLAGVVDTAAAHVDCGCDVVATLGRVDAVGQSIAWWAAENFLSSLTGSVERHAAWLVFLATFGISLLVAWSYSRALIGVLARPWHIEPLSVAYDANYKEKSA